jgi:hypothetical protein
MTYHYDPPTDVYTTKIPPGVAAIRRAVGEHFGIIRTEVVRDRSRCEDQRSEHCECRGVDFFTRDVALGRRIFAFCVGNAEVLGTQSAIFDRRIWGMGRAFERDYTGVHPHNDHVHIGINKWGAANVTFATVNQLLGLGMGDGVMEWENLEGTLKAAPGLAIKGNRVDIFVRGNDDAVWQRYFEGDWKPWERRGGLTYDAPVAGWTEDGKLHVFVRGDDDGLWHAWWDGASWKP